jgi:hypothetical protein
MLLAASLPQAALAPGLSRVLRLFFPLIKSATYLSCATLVRGEEPTGSAQTRADARVCLSQSDMCVLWDQ